LTNYFFNIIYIKNIERYVMSSKNLPSHKFPQFQQLTELCHEATRSLSGYEKVKITLSEHGGEIVMNSAKGEAVRIQVAPGYKEMSQGNIRGLPAEDQYSAVRSLLDQNFTQVQVAQRLNISQAYVSQIKRRNEVLPKNRTIEQATSTKE
jgi:hypothetical protein